MSNDDNLAIFTGSQYLVDVQGYEVMEGDTVSGGTSYNLAFCDMQVNQRFHWLIRILCVRTFKTLNAGLC